MSQQVAASNLSWLFSEAKQDWPWLVFEGETEMGNKALYHGQQNYF